MNYSLQIDPQKVSKEIVLFLKREFSGRKKKIAILGVSGGIDSAVTAFLCHKAGLKLYAINLPYNTQSIADGNLIASSIKLPKEQILTVNIGSSVDSQFEEIEKNTKLDVIDKGNMMARQRMIVQYALARKLGGLVIGTENLSEYYLAYFTLFGDQAYDIAPIAGLLKAQVYQLAQYLKVPEKIISKAPSADLWENQTDEKELGFSYVEADPIIYLNKIKLVSPPKIITQYGLKKSLVNKVIKRIHDTEFKREDVPKYHIKIKSEK
ncbi:MAG: NAD(+) synthase [Candidatus Paceibacterota bacterium]|jgi:NAD+ synthase